jgi:hypothetical protein
MRRYLSLLALAPLAACAAQAPAPHAPHYAATWSIVMQHAGNDYILDHGMTSDDCMAAKPVNRPDLDQWYACERETVEG